MGTRLLKPITPGRRFMRAFDFEEITKSKPEKSLTEALRKKGARSNTGRISIRYHGGGHKRRYRVIDFKRRKEKVPARVAAIEYDPNRSCRVALLHYADGEKSYILAPAGLKVNDRVVCGEGADVKPGHCMPLEKIPTGVELHNIELRPGKGGQLVRGAGVSAVLVAKEGRYCQLRLPSGEVRKILSCCKASVGAVGLSERENLVSGKAGRSRWLGRRPHVRGTCRNPVDHPMGGGEGRSKGNHPSTPWGKPCKGNRTRNNKRTSGMIIKARRRKAKA